MTHNEDPLAPRSQNAQTIRRPTPAELGGDKLKLDEIAEKMKQPRKKSSKAPDPRHPWDRVDPKSGRPW